MKTIQRRKRHIGYRLRFLVKTVFIALGLVLLCTHLQLLLSLPKFFSMMRKVSSWATIPMGGPTEAYPLDELKQVARFLSKQPSRERRIMIVVYSIYAKAQGDDTASSKLYLLLRVLFDVPEAYPRDKAKFFGGWRGWLENRASPESDTANLLWPLGYHDQRLALVDSMTGYFGLPYDGLGEYDYFASHFPLRSADELE